MASHAHSPALRLEPIQPGLPQDEIGKRLAAIATATPDPQALGGGAWTVAAAGIADLLQKLRDSAELRCDQLLDITGIDYLTYPGWRGPRFAVVYLLKSSVFRHRLTLKVQVEEDEAELPSAHAIFPIADWLEREVWDQYGIRFAGHPNLKRLLNHHEFVGHPLRKDYPVQKRQHLSINDPMLDELTARLRKKGYTVIGNEVVQVIGATGNAYAETER